MYYNTRLWVFKNRIRPRVILYIAKSFKGWVARNLRSKEIVASPDRNATTNARAMLTVLKLELARSERLIIPAPNVSGVPSKKAKRAASLRDKPLFIPANIVIPDLEVPGIRARI